MVLSFLIAAGLEIVDRSDDLVDGYGVPDDLCDLVHAPVGEGGFVQGVFSDAAGIDSLHF